MSRPKPHSTSLHRKQEDTSDRPTAESEADRFSSMSSDWYYSDTGATGRGSSSVMSKLKTESREAVLRILWI